MELACVSREDERSRVWRSVEFPDAIAGSAGAERQGLGGTADMEVDSSVEPAWVHHDIPPELWSEARRILWTDMRMAGTSDANSNAPITCFLC